MGVFPGKKGSYYCGSFPKRFGKINWGFPRVKKVIILIKFGGGRKEGKGRNLVKGG